MATTIARESSAIGGAEHQPVALQAPTVVSCPAAWCARLRRARPLVRGPDRSSRLEHPPLGGGCVVSGVLGGDAAERVPREHEGGDDILTLHTKKYIPVGMYIGWRIRSAPSAGDPRRELVRVREQGASELGDPLGSEPEADARQAQRPFRATRRGRTPRRPGPSCPPRSARGSRRIRAPSSRRAGCAAALCRACGPTRSPAPDAAPGTRPHRGRAGRRGSRVRRWRRRAGTARPRSARRSGSGRNPPRARRHTVSSARRTERNALSSVLTASERTMSRASRRDVVARRRHGCPSGTARARASIGRSRSSRSTRPSTRSADRSRCAVERDRSAARARSCSDAPSAPLAVTSAEEPRRLGRSPARRERCVVVSMMWTLRARYVHIASSRSSDRALAERMLETVTPSKEHA